MNNKVFNSIKILSVISFVSVIFIVILYFINESINEKNRLIKEYNNKIINIEKQAREYGLKNRSNIIKGSLKNNEQSTITVVDFNNDGSFKTINLNNNKKYNASEKLGKNEYRGVRILVKDLVNEGYINWDEMNSCANCTVENKEYYNNIVINPTNNNIINGCYIYIYYKDSEVYAHFDKYLCDKTQDDKYYNGQEYKQLNTK